jgi:hypothetical protein
MNLQKHLIIWVHHYWMTAHNWVNLLDPYYQPPLRYRFTSVNLLNALPGTKFLKSLMEMD